MRHPNDRTFPLFFAIAMFAAGLAAAAEDYPKATLDNGAVSIDIYLPDAATGFYRGLRYDHAGMVGQARWGGHTFFGELNKPHDPAVHDHGAGTVEEFGMTLTPPLGFAQAKAGEAFLKIGVGVLAKREDKENYWFAGPYKVLEWPAWKVDVKKDSVEFAQSAASPAGVAYEYVKRVELTKEGFRLVRRLKNTGKAKWSTDHYGHNYVIIDGRPIDPAYKVELPFEVKAEEEHEIKAKVEGRAVRPIEPLPAKGAIWVRVSGFGESPKDNVMRVENDAAKAGVEIATDLPMRRLVLYATRTAFCPESFTEIELEPGQTREWTTTYRFYKKD